MDDERLNVLSDEERQIVLSAPPGQRERFLNLFFRAIQNTNAIKNVCDDTKANLRVEPTQLFSPCAPMPSDLCRVSPFFPLHKAKLGERPYLNDIVITSSAWGRIEYSGLKLSVYEEDVLLALLSILDETKSNEYHGSMLKLVKRLGLQASKQTYARVLKSLKILQSGIITLTVFRQGKRQVKEVFSSNIVAACKWRTEDKVLFVALNPYFMELYKEGLTCLDISERNAVKTQVGRALYRFVMSQRDETTLHYLTLARSLNLDTEDLPAIKIRALCKSSITELIKHKVLQDISGFLGKDIVKLVRHPQTGVRKKV